MSATERFTADDPDQLSEESRNEGWELDYVQLEAGSFRGDFTRTSLNQLSLTRECYARRMELVGTIRSDVFPLVFILSGRGPGRFLSQSFEPGDLLHMDGGDECDLDEPEGLDFIGK